MTREGFHESLERIELELFTMGELTSTAVQRAIQALVDRDEEMAQAVIDADDPIDELYLNIDHSVLELLALQSPVAADLRLVSAILPAAISSASATRRSTSPSSTW
jgi:phosphate transport system protein